MCAQNIELLRMCNSVYATGIYQCDLHNCKRKESLQESKLGVFL